MNTNNVPKDRLKEFISLLNSSFYNQNHSFFNENIETMKELDQEME